MTHIYIHINICTYAVQVKVSLISRLFLGIATPDNGLAIPSGASIAWKIQRNFFINLDSLIHLYSAHTIQKTWYSTSAFAIYILYFISPVTFLIRLQYNCSATDTSCMLHVLIFPSEMTLQFLIGTIHYIY